MFTPQDLTAKEFSRVIRGYSVAEVDAYCEELKATCAELYNRNAELEKRVAALTAQNAELISQKPTPEHILGNARAAAEKIVDDANNEAAIIIASSKTSCDNLLNEFRYRLGTERDKLVELQTAVRNFKTAIYSAYQEHIDSVESIVDEADFNELDMEAQEYSTKVVSDIKTEVAFLMAELKQKREREAVGKIEDEYFENRDEVLAEELRNEEENGMNAETVVFNPDVDLSDLPEEMDENIIDGSEEEAIDMEIGGEAVADVPVAEPAADDSRNDVMFSESGENYDEVLEMLAEEINESADAPSEDSEE